VERRLTLYVLLALAAVVGVVVLLKVLG